MTEEQFRYLFDQHFDAIRRYLYYRSGDDAVSTDLAQDTFMKVWEKKMTLDPERDAALLYKIAGDLFVSHIRRIRLSREVFSEIRFDLTGESPDVQMQYEELKSKYETALVKLPEKQRIVFLMSRMEELTYREIAERLSIGIKAVEKRMTAALAILRKEINS
ncbi:MAG: sigma-70 family RNA polymerase sigma factor [Bacteroidales bacterium]|nr:sigma-70 family RNA polymerase sigma factor [Bacteroidales bacterium]